MLSQPKCLHVMRTLVPVYPSHVNQDRLGGRFHLSSDDITQIEICWDCGATKDNINPGWLPHENWSFLPRRGRYLGGMKT
jgi:hypothetical protein